MTFHANLALVLGIVATVLKGFGHLDFVPWEVVTWPIWGTIMIMFVYGFFEHAQGGG